MCVAVGSFHLLYTDKAGQLLTNWRCQSARCAIIVLWPRGSLRRRKVCLIRKGVRIDAWKQVFVNVVVYVVVYVEYIDIYLLYVIF